MKFERSKNAIRNVGFSWLNQIYTMLMPFVIRTVFIYTLGMEYLGLNSLFTSVLSVLNLAELGVGRALIFSMYKAIADDDDIKICALMKLYRKYYRIIGLVILLAGLVLMPFVPKLIKGTVPDGMNVYILYLINLSATVVTYWLFAYKNSLISAYQRSDISYKISMITITVQYVCQIIALVFLKNYYVFIIIMVAIGIVTNLVTAYVANKLFPSYHPTGSLSKEEVRIINKKVKDLFTSKIGGVVADSVDTVVISAFLGLTTLAIYQNYFYVVSAVTGFISVIFNSCLAGIGNSIVTESKEKNYNDMKKLSFIVFCISTFAVSCMLALYQPFIEIWTGKENMLGYGYVICFVVYFYFKQIINLLNVFKDASGIWHEDRFRPLVGAFSNLIMNLIMVQFWGLYGVILSTIVSTIVVSIPWIIHNLFSILFCRSSKEYIGLEFIFLLFVCVMASITTLICININFDSLILTMIVRLIVCAVLVSVSILVCFWKKKEFISSVQILDSITKGKIKFLSKLIR